MKPSNATTHESTGQATGTQPPAHEAPTASTEPGAEAVEAATDAAPEAAQEAAGSSEKQEPETAEHAREPEIFADMRDVAWAQKDQKQDQASHDDGPSIEEPPSQEHPKPSVLAAAPTSGDLLPAASESPRRQQAFRSARTHTMETPAAEPEAYEEPPPEPIEIQPGLFGLVELLLKDRAQLYQRLRDREGLSQTLPGLLLIALLCSGVVGGILGTYTGGWQILYVGLKLPLLLLLTLVVCYGSFWVWGLYFRTQIRAEQVAALTLASISTTALLLLGLSPFLWLGLSGGIAEMKAQHLNLIQQEAQYHRAILALVLCFGVAAAGGIRVLYKGIRAVAAQATTPRLGGTRLLATIWIGLYGFVGLQMAWILRPYLFHPWAKGRPLTFVRSLDGSVYESVAKTLFSVLGLGS